MESNVRQVFRLIWWVLDGLLVIGVLGDFLVGEAYQAIPVIVVVLVLTTLPRLRSNWWHRLTALNSTTGSTPNKPS